MKSGRIIVLEGLDGTGKSTAAKRLAKALGAVLLATPDASMRQRRRAFDSLYRSSPDAGQLFYASCVAHASTVAASRRAEGRDVVIDRYWLSTWAYAAIRGTRLSLEEVEAALCPADFTLVLTLDEAERHERLRLRGTTEGDRQTLDGAVAAKLDQRLRDGLRRPVAGRGCVLDLGGKSRKACVHAILERIGAHFF